MNGLVLLLQIAVGSTDGVCGAVADSIEAVQTAGKESAYRCLAADEAASHALMDWIGSADSDEVGRSRVQRALAIHLMERLDEPISLPALRMLSAADLRFLRDAVHARRGRKSPSSLHDQVFAKFDWYDPDSAFTNRRLTDVDRANLLLIDSPPSVAEVAAKSSAADAVVPSEAAPAEEDTAGCGCASSGRGVIWSGLLAACGLVGRRRRVAV